MRIPGLAFTLLGSAISTFRFPRLRRADLHPLGLSAPTLRPVMLSDDSWDGNGLIDITLAYGDPLDLSAPLVEVTTGLPDRIGGFQPPPPHQALTRLAHRDAAVEQHDVRGLEFDPEEPESDPGGPVTFHDAQVMVSGEPYQIQVLSHLHYQAARFVHDSTMTIIVARHHPLDTLELAPIPSIDPYLTGYTDFCRRMARHGWHI